MACMMNIFNIMFRNKLYFTAKSYCFCILNYMYNFSNDWFWIGMIGIWFCNYLMILLRNCKLWTVLVTQFMYSLGLSLCSFSKLDYINTYFTSVIEMFELGSFLFWPLGAWFCSLILLSTVFLFITASSHFINSDTYSYLQGRGLSKNLLL